jgi:tetratricopeptide (TPR) repeat protein
MELTIDQALLLAVDSHKLGKSQDAEVLYQAILQTHPSHPQANHNLGILAISKKDTRVALSYFKTALEANPNEGQYWISYIGTLIKENQYDFAKSVLKKGREVGLAGAKVDALERQLIEFGANSAIKKREVNRLLLAIELREAGRYQEAEDWLSGYLTSETSDAEAWSLLSQVYMLNKNDAEAHKALLSAITIDPNLPSIHRNHARFLLRQAKTKEALERAESAYKISGDDPESWLVLASCLAANQRDQDALPLIQKALQARPNYAEAFITSAMIRWRKKDNFGAIKDAEMAVSLKPHLTQSWVLLGALHYQSENLSGAIEALKKAHELEPTNVKYMVDLGEFLRQAKNIAEAIAILEAATKLSSIDGSAWTNLGVAYQDAGKVEAAKVAYKKALAINPKSAEISSNLGVIAKDAEDWESALWYFEQALQVRPDRVDILVNKALSLVALGQFEAARKAAEYLISLDKTHIPSLLALSSALRGQNKYSEAKTVLEQAIKYAQQNQDHLANSRKASILRQLAGVHDELKRHEEAHGYLDTALKIKEDDPDTLQAMGNHYARLERWEAAESWVRKALAIRPEKVSILRQLAGVLDELKRHEEAHGYLDNALKIKEDDADTLQAMGSHYARLKLWEDAKAIFSKAIALKPDDAAINAHLGNVLEKRGELEAAEASYRKAIGLKPGDATAHNNLGNILQELGKLEAAEASFKSAIELNPGLAEAHCNLGITLKRLGRLEDAEACYRKAIALKPDFAEVYGNLCITLYELGKLVEAEASCRQMLTIKSEFVSGTTASRVTALLHFGRSGSLFFHSLFDGHPEIATVPGVYLKGWFGMDRWQRFAPDFTQIDWRERLVAKIIEDHKPLFDANCKNDVAGNPFGHPAWLAKDQGFTEMGADHAQCFVLDQKAFANMFLSMLKEINSIGLQECFELFHRAFERAIRRNTGPGSQRNGHIFYHIHNPDPFERAHFLQHYPQARLLQIMRNPVQCMESWMLMDLSDEVNQTWGNEYRINRWNKMVDKVSNLLTQMRLPSNELTNCRGIRLEDVKRNPRITMPQIAAWVGVSDHETLYESSFCGLQYWGPSSKVTGRITGFDTKAIDQPLGRLFGPRDILIFETLFWPLSHLYGYTDMGVADFRRQLADIRPWLDMPLEFEANLYSDLPDDGRALEDLPPYKRLHRLMQQYWVLLDRDGTYQDMVPPLNLD